MAGFGTKPSRKPTRKLFKDFNPEGTETLEAWHDIFIEECDPTEYRAAIRLCGSWDEWLRFKREWPAFQEIYLNSWLEEVEVKTRSIAVTNLAREADKGNVAAARFLAEGRYKERKPGRTGQERIREQNVRKKVAQKVDPEVARVLDFVRNKERIIS